MIPDLDNRLVSWLGDGFPEVTVSLSPPSPPAPGAGPTVSVYLYEIKNAPVLRGVTPAPYQAMLRYLITVTAPTVQEEHALLSNLLFAAFEFHDAIVDLDPLPTAFWSALGLPLRPAFVLCLVARKDRTFERPPLIRQPLVMQLGPLTRLTGRVIASDSTPLVGAMVDLPALDVRRTTDTDGRFSFDGVPMDSSSMSIVVRSKSHKFDSTIQQVTTKSGELLVTIPIEEG